MNTVKSTHCSSFRPVALAAIVCLFGAAQALAADPDGLRSETVNYRDLDLSTIEGATALYQRIKHAANSVCGEPETSIERSQAWDCYQAAIADAVAKVNSPLLTAMHGGKSKSKEYTTAMKTR